MSAAFEARFGGRCAACDEGIRVGDMVRYSEDQVIHNACDDMRPEQPLAPPCERCFMVPAANGECGCDA